MVKLNGTMILMSGGINCAALLGDMKFRRLPVKEALIFYDLHNGTDEDIRYAKEMAARFELPWSLWSVATHPMMDMNVAAQPDIMDPISTIRMSHTFMLMTAAFRAKQMGYAEVVTGHMRDNIGMDDFGEFMSLGASIAKISGMPISLFQYPMAEYGDKSDVFMLARDRGVLVEALARTNSCVKGEDKEMHDWGYGCGGCSGCNRRSAGWAGYLEKLKAEGKE